MLDPSKFRNNPVERPWYKPALAILKKTKFQNKKILDFGSGLCEFSEKLKKIGFKVECVDGSKNYVLRAKKLGYNAVRADFNEKIPIKSNTYDYISALEVIEHIEKAELMLSELNRMLKKGGYLVISTPNYAYFGIRLHMLLGKPIPDEGYHYRFFTFNTLRKLLQNNGFKIIEEKAISFTPLYRISRIFKPKTINVGFAKNLLGSKMIFLVKKVK